MFSPDAPSHSHSLRPKRTRTAGPDDSLKLPQAKRKRSALRRDTFEPLQTASLNEITGRPNGAEDINGRAVLTEKPPSSINAQSKELTLRGGKKTDKRSERSSGALTLSSNEFYTVAQLPALPDQIRSRPTIPYSCSISPEYGYALALTHSDALIWSYNSSTTSPSSRDLLSFKLPFHPSSAADPLPLATFTAKSAAGEPGVVAVAPKSGKVVYWETITNASSFVPGQTSSGVQGSIPGMLSGETVKEITNAEPAGFILSLSHGRIAHLTIRDQMGRPGIGVQFLRKAATSGPVGGLFGSIRHAFGGDRRKGIPIVRAGRSSKGQRDVLVATEDGEVEFWNTNLGVGNSMVKALNIKEDLLDALKYNVPQSTASDFRFKLLDVELAAGPSSGHDLTRLGDETSIPVTILAALSVLGNSTYYIIESIITGATCTITVVHPIKCYTASLSESASWRPKLYLPKHSEMAFVVFEKAIVLFSLAKIEESPSSQLLLERHALPDPFQDCIRFQEDTIYKVLGLAMEDRERSEKQSSCVFAVQGFGIVRITSLAPEKPQEDEDDELVARISPKSKIEQAVFFGTIRQNPLDLMSSTAGQTFTAEELSSAALEISSEILSSSSKYLPKTTPSIDMQMKMRAKALEDLAHYLLKHFASSLSRATRFQLLWNAEKLAAAQAIWKVQEEIQRPYPNLKDREMSYMHFVLKALHETRQSYPEESKGEKDRVRHWLANDPERIGYFVTELVSCLDELKSMEVTDPRVVADYLREADDLWIAAYEAAFKFRDDNAHTYGLGDEVFKDGVLTSGYPEELPQVWTSDEEPFQSGENFIYEICKFLDEWWDYNATKSKKRKMPVNEDGRPYEAPSQETLETLAQKLPTQVELFGRMIEEESIHAQQQARWHETDPGTRAQIIQKLKNETRPKRRAAIIEISRFNMAGAIKLAEKLADTGLLVTLNTTYLRVLTAEQVMVSSSDHTEAMKIGERILAIQDHAETYFDTFGNAWAFAHFSHMMREGEVNAMLQEAQADEGKKQAYLNWFLKKCKAVHYPVGKVSWINDILGERKYRRAQTTLDSVANEDEDALWGKRTEICLAKLANLAASEDAAANSIRTATSNAKVAEYDNALVALDIQESVYLHVAPAMAQTIDIMAAQEVVEDVFGKRVTEKTPSLKRLLRRALSALVEKKALSPQQLVDLLTLMDPVEFGGADDEEDPSILGREFSRALKVVDVSDSISNAEKDALRRLIWRRAMIRDDWIALNETSNKDDATVEQEMHMSSLFRTLVEVLSEQNAETQNPKLYSPQQILDADVFPESLWKSYDEEQWEGVEKDLQTEQERLRSFVEKGQLEMHFGGLVRTAEGFVRAVRDRQGDEIASAVLGGEEGMNMDMDRVESNGLH